MNILLSFALLLFLVGIVGWKIFRANRLAAKFAREKERERQRKEQEILARLDSIKKKTDLDHAKKLVDKDPKRAAKVLSNMMKKG